MEVVSGVPFDVELGSTPATGYTWELEPLPEGVELLGSDFSMAPEAAVGDGGKHVFHLRATRHGRFDLRFVRKRRWETESIDSRVIVVESRRPSE